MEKQMKTPMNVKKSDKWTYNDHLMFEEVISNIKYAVKYRETCSAELGLELLAWLESFKQRMMKTPMNVKKSDMWTYNNHLMFEEVISNIKYAVKHRETCSEKLGLELLGWLESFKQRIMQYQESLYNLKGE